MKDSENPYKLLKIDSEAPLEVVKAAYRALMKSSSMHPDLGGENHLAQEINDAYQILSDSEQRRKIDSKLKTNKQFVAEEKKEISEYFVVCLYCQAINRILHPQWVKQSQFLNVKLLLLSLKKELLNLSLITKMDFPNLSFSTRISIKDFFAEVDTS